MAKSNPASDHRIAVQKTSKLYIDGKFPRSESGRTYTPVAGGNALGNICLASRKDLRNAVVAARSSQLGWWERSAYNRGQILYRIGEMLEGRSDQFIAELRQQGASADQARKEVAASVDRWIYYAGWCDKVQQVFSSVNPVATSHFNFSILEPTGVVFIIASEESALLGLVSLVAPIIAGGNVCIVLASESKPLSALTLGEVLQTSDVPPGVVNLLTGSKHELIEPVARHHDINAVAVDGSDRKMLKQINEFASENMKRVKQLDLDWSNESAENPYLITDFCEVKTIWHPIEKISASGSGY